MPTRATRISTVFISLVTCFLLASTSWAGDAKTFVLSNGEVACARDALGQEAPALELNGEPHWQLRQDLKAMFTEAGTPGAAVIAVQGNEPIFEMYYGCRSSLPGERWAVTPDTSFLLASLSKTWTATTVLALADLITEHANGNYEGSKAVRELLGVKSEGAEPLTVDDFLNRKISEFFPTGFEIDYPSCEENPAVCPRQAIRFVDLLEHTSGIVDDYSGPLNCVYNLDADSPMSLEQMVRNYLNESMSQTNELYCLNVGEAGWSTEKYEEKLYGPDNFGRFGVFRYSNSGYTLLGHMVELVLERVCPWLMVDSPESKLAKACAASGQYAPEGSDYPMWKFSRHVVEKPLGLESQGELAGSWLLSGLEDSTNCVALDKGEKRTSEQCKIARPAGNLPYYNFPGYPNGGFRTTARGLSHFLTMLMNDGEFRDQQILAPETARSIWNFSSRPWPWQALTSRGFTVAALGFSLQAYDVPETYNGMIVGHTGGEMGVATSMFWLPVPSTDGGELHNSDKSLGVLVITNGDGLDAAVTVRVLEEFQASTIPGSRTAR